VVTGRGYKRFLGFLDVTETDFVRFAALFYRFTLVFRENAVGEALLVSPST